ncbi:MAG TPA: hypothetical protein VGL38_12385 [bacterium]|jgi:hypothetical protein
MPEKTFDDIKILEQVLTQLRQLDPPEQRRILGLINKYFEQTYQIDTNRGRDTDRPQIDAESRRMPIDDFSRDRTISAKEFLFQKKPQADVEKIACLAYYLTHYQNLTEFQTRDISLANTEAAQRKLSNPSLSLSNAVAAGYIISPSKNFWRLSAIGEIFVQALPDRDAAKAAVAESKPTRRSRRPKNGTKTSKASKRSK